MESSQPLQDVTPLLKDAQALRRHMDTEGCAYFRGLIPPDDILDLRRQVLQIYHDRGWLQERTALLDGIVDPVINQVESYASNGADREAYQAVYQLQAFHQLAHHSAILTLFEQLFGETVLVHPRNIARLMAPHKDTFPTPPHQDYIYVQGARATYTCWIPLGDCPKALGGLSLLPGTHQDLLPVRPADGAGGRTVVLDGLEQNWQEGDYQTGDAVIFHSQTVHRALPNQSADRIRLSCDYRYQPLSMPVEPKSLEPHVGLMTWEETYAGWTDQSLQYYWRDLDLQLNDFDMSLLEPAAEDTQNN
ncbi:MAG: phytanoyl-CoA dioxygenase [Candidatus Latescibacteria bacterium]|nr:phytanoyl-CoA dioxygenase [Candidatus Latescibacterota bacterium]